MEKETKIKVQVGKSGRELLDTRERDLRARDSIHSTTLGSVCIANRFVRHEMSRTPSCTMQYFYLTRQLELETPLCVQVYRTLHLQCCGRAINRRWPVFSNRGGGTISGTSIVINPPPCSRSIHVNRNYHAAVFVINHEQRERPPAV